MTKPGFARLLEGSRQFFTQKVRAALGNLAKPGALVLLAGLAAHAQRPLMPVPAQATWQAGHYRFATAPLLALHRQTTGPATSTDESYHLRVTAAGASLTAASALGMQRGIATFRQVLERQPRHQHIEGAPAQRPGFPQKGQQVFRNHHVRAG